MLTLTFKHQLPLTHHLPLQHRMGGYAPATNRYMTAYLATKAGANSYAMGTRAVLAAAGVGVTLACPGFVRSRMTKELGEQGVQFYGLWSTERAVDAIVAGAARNSKQHSSELPSQLNFDWLKNGTLHQSGICNKTSLTPFPALLLCRPALAVVVSP